LGDAVNHVSAHLGQVVSSMIRFLPIQDTSSSSAARAAAAPPPRPTVLLPAALLGATLLLVGCTEKSATPSPAVTDAAAALVREQVIRDAMVGERKKLEGEKQFHLLQSRIIAGELKPTIMAAESRSPIVRALPSWGVRRLWRLWGRRAREMPWFDEGSGSKMKTNVENTYKARDDDLAKRILMQDRKIDEAKKYLDLVKSLDEDA